MKKQYKSEALASAHEAALGLAEAGVLSRRTMREFDEMCLTPVREMTPEKIPRVAATRARQPGGVCVLPESDHEPGEPVGAGPEAATGRLVEAPDSGREERSGRGRVKDPPSHRAQRHRVWPT